MGQNIVKGIDKWKNQQTVKSLYINGESNIKADLHKSLDNSDITAIPEPEKNRVYMFDITYSPSYEDRKSTRLKSSHVSISYAVFCLKKKIKSNFYVIY